MMSGEVAVNAGVDLRPLFEQVVLPLAGALFTALSSAALEYMRRLTKAKLTQQQAQQLEAAIQNGINYALSKAKERDGALGSLPVKNQLVEDAFYYLAPKVPEVLKALKITPDGLRERIESRLIGGGHA